MSKSNGRLRFSKKVVIAAITAVVGYTLIHLAFNWFGVQVQTELTVGWFAFWGVEVVALMKKAIEGTKACGCTENNLKGGEVNDRNDRAG